MFDFIGACIAALMLGLVVPALNEYIQMPLNTLYLLAVFAGFFALYSLVCYLKKVRDVAFYLNLIGTLNLSYCGAIAILTYMHFEKLTTLGIIYFGVDIALVSTLAILEFKAAKRAV
ncbi:MAG: hypothetical protein ABJG68_02625 [Crocinitomicaceae bacterium]